MSSGVFGSKLESEMSTAEIIIPPFRKSLLFTVKASDVDYLGLNMRNHNIVIMDCEIDYAKKLKLQVCICIIYT